jgi:hypothetical protein
MAIAAALAAMAVADAAIAAVAAVATTAAAVAAVPTVVEAAATAAVDTGKIRLNARNEKPALLRQAGFLCALRLLVCPQN